MSRSDRPNLVFIFSDQQSTDMAGAYGVGSVRTPNLDALAADGVTFTRCISNSPVCTPYRGMLITGQHPLRNNCFTNDRRLATDIGESFAEVLAGAGYRSGYVGKWHLYGGNRYRPVPAGPDRHGFDATFLTNNCDVNYHPDHAFYWGDDNLVHRFGTWEVEGQTDQALEFIDRQTADQPFSLFVSYHPPHNHLGGDEERFAGFDAPEEFKALYDPDEIELRPSLPDNPRTRRMMQGYLALCSEVDHHVGRMITRLDELGLLDNTIVIYTSDHGETFGGYLAHWHKSTPEDASIAVPLIIRLPGRELAGSRRDLLVGTLDLMPTILGLMGIRVPAECQGLDLSAAIGAGDDDAVESVPLFYFPTPWRGVVTRRWTYAIEHVDRSTAAVDSIGSDLGRSRLLRTYDVLYDHDEDPHQLRNLYGQADTQGFSGVEAAHRELHRLTLAWLDRFEDPFPDQTELEALTGDRPGSPMELLRDLTPWRPDPVR